MLPSSKPKADPGGCLKKFREREREREREKFCVINVKYKEISWRVRRKRRRRKKVTSRRPSKLVLKKSECS